MSGLGKKWLRLLFLGSTAAGCIAIGQAQATEGYFSHGFGARNMALGGAGVADSRDAMALAINPAGLVNVGRQYQSAITLFSPMREYKGTGTSFVAPGTNESKREFFPIPNSAYNYPLSEDSAIGFASFGNGGMNTTYHSDPNPNCAAPPFPSTFGVYCGSGAGVDLIQAFVAVGYAHRFGRLSVGVSPILAMQRFKAKGLGAFAGLSSDPSNLTNEGYSWSVGGGVRVGAEFAVLDNVRVGASFQTKMYMSKFGRYSGLFEGGGEFDIPANVTVGLAVDVMPDVTVMFDYKRIFYSDVDSIGNSSSIMLPFGSSGGPGFGWNDIDIFKVGAEWRVNGQWTLRAGYAHNENPIDGSDVTLNILAPGIVKNHFTGGASYKLNENNTIDFAAMFAPNTKVSGIEVTPFGPTPGSNIQLEMHQYALTFGWTYNFDPM